MSIGNGDMVIATWRKVSESEIDSTNLHTPLSGELTERRWEDHLSFICCNTSTCGVVGGDMSVVVGKIQPGCHVGRNIVAELKKV